MLTDSEMRVIREMIDESDALIAKANSLPRWRWYARWRLRDKANIIRIAAGRASSDWQLLHAIAGRMRP